MNLKQHAKKYTSGGITWYLMPYQTLRNQAVSEQFDKIVPLDDRNIIEQTFVTMEAFTVDVEFAPELSAVEQRFADYWNNRPMPIVERWDAFSFLVDLSIADVFWNALTATRDLVIEKNEPVSAKDLPNSFPASANT